MSDKKPFPKKSEHMHCCMQCFVVWSHEVLTCDLDALTLCPTCDGPQQKMFLEDEVVDNWVKNKFNVEF